MFGNDIKPRLSLCESNKVTKKKFKITPIIKSLDK
jgi:hypothetical protein